MAQPVQESDKEASPHHPQGLYGPSQFPRPERLPSAPPGGRRPKAESGPSAGRFPRDGWVGWGESPILESRDQAAQGLARLWIPADPAVLARPRDPVPSGP